MRVTEDEADSMAVPCEEPKCWAVAGKFCKTPSGVRRRPHPGRVKDAARAGLLGGQGRAELAAAALLDAGTIGGVTLILPPETADAG